MASLHRQSAAMKARLRAWAQRPWLQEAQAFGVYLAGRIREDQCIKSAGMLAYVTLLAIVPLLTISFSILAAFPVFEGVTDRLREAMVEYLVPAASEAVDEHLESFLGRTTELTAIGVAALAVSALLLLNTVERVLNEIWRVRQPRPKLQQFMVYWTVLTLGPLLLAVSVVSTSYMGTVTLGPLEPPSALIAQLLTLAPFVVQAVVFALLYSMVPHHTVPVRHAAIGGILASALFEVAKAGFAQFIARAPTYEAIYGALAALPIFLVWLYISWVVILLGAELTQALRGYRWRTRGPLAADRWALLLAVRLIGDLYQAEREGRGLTFGELLEREPTAGEPALLEALEQLRSSRIIDYNAEGYWILKRDPGTLSLAELQRRHAFPLPPAAELESSAHPWDHRLAEQLRQLEAQLGEALETPLTRIIATEAGAPSAAAGQVPEAQSTARMEAL